MHLQKKVKMFHEEKTGTVNPDSIIYPLMCMSSIEPVKVKSRSIKSLSPDLINLANERFSVQFSAFKKEEGGANQLHFIVGSLTSLVSPEFIVAAVDDINSNEAKEFLNRPLSQFDSFKKAILLFEPRAYSLKEFEEVIKDWKESLEQEL